MKECFIFFRGFMTGLVLQLAIGPVFIFIINISLQNGAAIGFASVVAVTIVDYFYITLAIIGIGKLLEDKKRKRLLNIISSAILILFGVLMIKKGFFYEISLNQNSAMNHTLIKNFISAFILTISNPLTIVFWTGIFTTKAVEYSLNKKELLIFGLSAGLAPLFFLGLSVLIISFIKVLIPKILFQILNITVGCLLIGYGMKRIKQ